MIADTAFSAWLLDSFIAFTALLMFVLAVRRPVAQWLGPQAAYLLWLLPAARWFVPPLMLPGPRSTAKLTGRPLEAVAERFTVAVVAWSAIGGKSIVWSCGGAPTLP